MDSLAVFVLASFLLALTPGPDNLFVLTQSAQHGKKVGILITLGLCTGLIFHTTLVALGLAILFKSSIALTLLKWLGACYLLFLAFKALTSTLRNMTESDQLSNVALYQRGIIMNVTNPKVSLFFLAFLPQFIPPDTASYSQQVFLLGSLFAVTALIVLFCIAYSGGALQELLKQSPAIQLSLNRIGGIVLILLAINFLISPTP
ncbi:MAG: LysE family translocator [Porticoccaceae bacterium]|nr:LysE family translocator [Porticoccaceae bacterium]